MDNVRDKQERGRQPKGENHYAAKLSDQDVIDMRKAHAGGAWQGDLARKYGVDPSHVSDIINNKSRVIN
jgi:DNA-binding MarR family transcriptional regulator